MLILRTILTITLLGLLAIETQGQSNGLRFPQAIGFAPIVGDAFELPEASGSVFLLGYFVRSEKKHGLGASVHLFGLSSDILFNSDEKANWFNLGYVQCGYNAVIYAPEPRKNPDRLNRRMLTFQFGPALLVRGITEAASSRWLLGLQASFSYDIYWLEPVKKDQNL